MAHPEDFYLLEDPVTSKNIVFELGFKLNYLEVFEFALKLLRDGFFNQTTLARFHGGCPGGVGDEPGQ